MSEHGGPALAMFWLRDERNVIPPWRFDGAEDALRDRYGAAFDWCDDWTMPTTEEAVFGAVRGMLPRPGDAPRWEAAEALAALDSPFGRSWAECSALVFQHKEEILYREDDEYRAMLGMNEDDATTFSTSYMPRERSFDGLFDDEAEP